MASPYAARARVLVQQGRVQEAVQVLSAPAAAQDAEALFTLATWALEGRFITRSLEVSREYFRRAAGTGHLPSYNITINFLASGTGGPRLWVRATDLLRDLAAHDPAARRQLEMLAKMELTADGESEHIAEARVLSQSPDVRYFDRFWTAAECDYLA